jgi:hypothetical protein
MKDWNPIFHPQIKKPVSEGNRFYFLKALTACGQKPVKIKTES